MMKNDSIGKRYRRQGVIGTLCRITEDHQAIADNNAIIRDIDTMQQERVAFDESNALIAKKIKG